MERLLNGVVENVYAQDIHMIKGAKMKKEKSIQGITAKEFLSKAKKYLNTITKEEFMSDLKVQADIEAIRVLKILKKAEFRVNVSNSLQTAISALEAMRDAEMPERMVTPKFSGKKGYFEFQHERNRGINVGIDLCQPIVSKLLLRIKELRELNQ